MNIIRSVFLTLCMLTLPLAAHAKVDYSRVINLSGKQRMLTQKMSKEAVLVALGVDAAANAASLKVTHDLFDKTLKGLRNGDDSLGLPPTKKPKILSALDDVDNLWADFAPAIAQVATAGAATDAEITVISSQNVALLKASNKAVKLYEAAAAGGDLNPALAVAINLAGRQRMLTQKMSKEFFLVAKGHNADANKASLAKTVALFDSTLNGLINGDDAQGLSPAPTDEIHAQLKKVQGMWNALKPSFGADPTPESIQAVAAQNLPLLKEMNVAVGMFEALGQ